MIVFDVQQEMLKKGQGLSGRQLTYLAEAIDEESGKSLQGIVSVAFISASKMHTLTKQYKKEDHISDILTFPLVPPRHWKAGEIVGEILLCYPRLVRQIKKDNRSPKGEIAFLLVHGVLHLQGRTHKTARALEKMIADQKKILARASIPYSL